MGLYNIPIIFVLGIFIFSWHLLHGIVSKSMEVDSALGRKGAHFAAASNSQTAGESFPPGLAEAAGSSAVTPSVVQVRQLVIYFELKARLFDTVHHSNITAAGSC
jgi:hypothetical protein